MDLHRSKTGQSNTQVDRATKPIKEEEVIPVEQSDRASTYQRFSEEPLDIDREDRQIIDRAFAIAFAGNDTKPHLRLDRMRYSSFELVNTGKDAHLALLHARAWPDVLGPNEELKFTDEQKQRAKEQWALLPRKLKKLVCQYYPPQSDLRGAVEIGVVEQLLDTNEEEQLPSEDNQPDEQHQRERRTERARHHRRHSESADVAQERNNESAMHPVARDDDLAHYLRSRDYSALPLYRRQFGTSYDRPSQRLDSRRLLPVSKINDRMNAAVHCFAALSIYENSDSSEAESACEDEDDDNSSEASEHGSSVTTELFTSSTGEEDDLGSCNNNRRYTYRSYRRAVKRKVNKLQVAYYKLQQEGKFTASGHNVKLHKNVLNMEMMRRHLDWVTLRNYSGTFLPAYEHALHDFFRLSLPAGIVWDVSKHLEDEHHRVYTALCKRDAQLEADVREEERDINALADRIAACDWANLPIKDTTQAKLVAYEPLRNNRRERNRTREALRENTLNALKEYVLYRKALLHLRSTPPNIVPSEPLNREAGPGETRRLVGPLAADAGPLVPPPSNREPTDKSVATFADSSDAGYYHPGEYEQWMGWDIDSSLEIESARGCRVSRRTLEHYEELEVLDKMSYNSDKQRKARGNKSFQEEGSCKQPFVKQTVQQKKKEAASARRIGMAFPCSQLEQWSEGFRVWQAAETNWLSAAPTFLDRTTPRLFEAISNGLITEDGSIDHERQERIIATARLTNSYKSTEENSLSDLDEGYCADSDNLSCVQQALTKPKKRKRVRRSAVDNQWRRASPTNQDNIGPDRLPRFVSFAPTAASLPQAGSVQQGTALPMQEQQMVLAALDGDLDQYELDGIEITQGVAPTDSSH